MASKKTPEHTEQNHKSPEHSSPYPVSRLAPPIQLVDLARQIEKADLMIGAQVNSKLQVISEQIKKLQDQAREVLEKAREDQDLHRVKCNFKRIPGHTYHLYAKADSSRYFSMLSPDDWRGQLPDEYLGPYRLEADMSWIPAEDIGKKENGLNEIIQYLMEEQERE